MGTRCVGGSGKGRTHLEEVVGDHEGEGDEEMEEGEQAEQRLDVLDVVRDTRPLLGIRIVFMQLRVHLLHLRHGQSCHHHRNIEVQIII